MTITLKVYVQGQVVHREIVPVAEANRRRDELAAEFDGVVLALANI